MNGPLIAFFLFIIFIIFFYYYQNYFLFIPRTLSLIFGFLLLVVPQYVDSISNYIFYKSQMLNYDLNEKVQHNINITKDNENTLLWNQNNECYHCKKKLNKYIIKSRSPFSKKMTNYYIICTNCNKNKFINSFTSRT
jgi:hypothetical protein